MNVLLCSIYSNKTVSKTLDIRAFSWLKTTFQVIDWTICRKYGRNIITIFFKFVTFIIATIIIIIIIIIITIAINISFLLLLLLFFV